LAGGCNSPQEIDLNRGLQFQSRGEFREAVTEFDKVMKRSPRSLASIRAARESAKIYLYELKNYDRTIEVLKFLILYSNNSEERWKSQSQIAQIYFDNLAWYDKALIEYNKLLAGHLSKEEQIRVRLAIARSYYYLGQFLQSSNEASQILVEQGVSEDQAFDVYLLQANIYLSLKNHFDAAKALERILQRFPDKSKKENVGINLALCYEEMGVHTEALRVLESLKSYYEPKEYVELRIRKIRERYLNLPKTRIKK
jgi:tetratricopeptide (TPR) repeat protein